MDIRNHPKRFTKGDAEQIMENKKDEKISSIIMVLDKRHRLAKEVREFITK